MKTSRVLGGILNSAVAGIALMLAGLLLIPLNISVLGAEKYGIWLTISVIATYLYYSDLGIGLSIIHFGSQARAKLIDLSSSTLLSCGVAWASGICAIIGVGFWFGANAFMNSRFVDAGISASEGDSLILLGILLLSAIVVKPFEATLVGAGFLNYQRRTQIAGALFRIVGTVIACATVGTVVAVAAVEAVALVLPAVVSAIIVLRRRIARIETSSVRVSVFRVLFGYSIKSFATNAVGALILQAGIMIAAIVGTPSDVTYFTAAFRVYNSIRQVVSWLTEPFRPLMSRIWLQDPGRARSTLQLFLFLTSSIIAIGCISIIMGADDLVGLWLGDTVPVAEVAATLSILVAGLLLNVVHIPLIPAIDGAGRPGAYFSIQVVWLVSYILLAVFLGNQFGIAGIAMGLSAPLVLLEPFYLAKGLSILGISWREWGRSVLLPSAIVCGGGAMGVVLLCALFRSLGANPSGVFMAVCFGIFAGASLIAVGRSVGLEKIVQMMRVEL